MRRFWILAGAFTATAVTFALAFLLGAWGFDYRRYSQHAERMRHVLEQEPTIGQLTAGLESEGASVLASPDTSEELESAILAHGRDKVEELRRRARRWAHARIFRAADMLYFVFFDDEQIVRDFVLVDA